MNRRQLLTGTAYLLGVGQANAFGLGRLGAGEGRLGGLAGAGKSTPGVLRAAITGVVNFAADIRQTNLLGTALSGVINVATDITLAAGVQIGAAISGTAAFAANIVQTNLIGASMSGTINVAGDIASASAWDYDAEYLTSF